jgi:trk system potassium uptake protein
MSPSDLPAPPAPIPAGTQLAARPVRGAWKVAIAAAVPLIVDVAYPSWATGLIATGAMAAFCASGWRSLKGLRAVRLTQIGLLVGTTGLLLARALILARQVKGDSGAGAAQAATSYDLAFFGLEGALVLVRTAERRVERLGILLLERPALMLTASFVGLIIAGAFLLSMPFAVHQTGDISLLDALFTATSAVCVTGLAVNDLGAIYTPFGWSVILVLIQLGGLGIMTISGLALNFTSGLEMQARYTAMLDARNFADMRALVRNVVVLTLVIEAIGALLLVWLFWGNPLVEERGGVFLNAVFHAVSAFTNCGFSLFTSLAPWRADAGVQLVLMILIVLGGIGFPVLHELVVRSRARLERGGRADPRQLSMGSRVALATSGILLAGGAILFAALEIGHLSADLSAWEYAWSALFTSVVSRTAGFSTIDIGVLLPSTLLIVMVLMFIGGSPGSCAGGIKTTTAAVLVSSLSAELRRHEPRLLGRTLFPGALRRAIAVTIISVGVVLAALLLLTMSEQHSFLELAFETVSAFGTVGLSTGITPSLSAAGKLIIVATMFMGRVGPLTVVLALGDRRERPLYRLAPEDLNIG